MAKKDSGFWNNLFDGIFDLNGDGKDDLYEQLIAYEIFDNYTAENNKTSEYSPHCNSSSIYDSDYYSPYDNLFSDIYEDYSEFDSDSDDFEL